MTGFPISPESSQNKEPGNIPGFSFSFAETKPQT
jgi:hypothetical protein